MDELKEVFEKYMTDDLKPTLRQAIQRVLDHLGANFPDIDPQDHLTFILFTAPVWAAIMKQADLTYPLLLDDSEGENED